MALPAKIKKDGYHHNADPEAVQLLMVKNHRRHPRQRRIRQKEETEEWPERRLKGTAEPGKLFLAFASMDMRHVRGLSNPIRLVIIMAMQLGLVFPSWQRLLGVFRGLLDFLAGKIDEYFRLVPTHALDPAR